MLEKMQNKYIYIIDNINTLEELKGKKIAYPLKSFSVGFNNYFCVEQMLSEESYIYINGLLSTSDINKLKLTIKNLPSNIKGVFFEDLGVYEVIKNLGIEKIFLGSHILTNSNTVNNYLELFDSCLISPDITFEETNSIIKNSIKPVCIFGYGHLNLSYSKRLLNKGYSDNFKIEYENNLVVKNTDFEFLINENENGTVIYDSKVYDALEFSFENNILYVLINTYNDALNNRNKTTGFLNKKTIYKLKKGNKNV